MCEPLVALFPFATLVAFAFVASARGPPFGHFRVVCTCLIGTDELEAEVPVFGATGAATVVAIGSVAVADAGGRPRLGFDVGCSEVKMDVDSAAVDVAAGAVVDGGTGGAEFGV